MSYFVTPVTDKRRQQWEKVYGRSYLPVKYAQPHLACTQRWGDVSVYYLDTAAVPEMMLNRIAGLEARRMGISYAEARLSVRREWLIRADGCQIVQHLPADQSPLQPAFAFLRQMPLRARGRRATAV